MNILNGGGSWLLGIPVRQVYEWWRFGQDKKILSPEKRQELEEMVDDIARRMGVKKKLHITAVPGFHMGAQALGSELLPGKAGIVISPQIVNIISKNELEFILAHEISHIKNNDSLTMLIGAALVAAITTVAFFILFPGFVLADYCAFAASSLAFVMISRKCELNADRDGMSYSQNGAAGAQEFFERILEHHLKVKNNLHAGIWEKFIIDSEGNSRLDFLHPPLTQRIQNAENACTQALQPA